MHQLRRKRSPSTRHQPTRSTASVSLSHIRQVSPSGIIITNALVASQMNAKRIVTKKTMKIAASVQLQRPGI
ncbi:MAG: hypothetical protein CK550_01345 [Gemmatimonadetes bacterium]|nr:MAG: hypothetical protein CK550_01345 [Gemmatimonadota bacterium]